MQFWLSELAQFNSALPDLTVDGSFGAATEKAVKIFQQEQGLTADGYWEGVKALDYVTLPEDFDAASTEMIQPISAEAEEAHVQAWTEFKNACGQ